MHRKLHEALSDAEGFSDLVLVVFLDVRGFSSFARMAESSEAALFLRRMYLNILNEYFPNATFFKPTGDGLMIIRHFDEESLRDEVEWAIRASVRLVENFPAITNGDAMINFDVPKSLGIGITRGAATRLASGDLTLDYSGRPLNLAARLMDLARPSGVVFDAPLIKDLDLEDGLAETFRSDDVYVKGIADISSMQVFRSLDVQIPTRNRHPLEGRPFDTEPATMTFKAFKERGKFVHRPPVEPLDPEQVECVVRFPVPTANGRKHASMKRTMARKPEQTWRRAEGWELGYDYGPFVKRMESIGVKDTWAVEVLLRYVTTEAVFDADESENAPLDADEE